MLNQVQGEERHFAVGAASAACTTDAAKAAPTKDVFRTGRGLTATRFKFRLTLSHNNTEDMREKVRQI